MTNEEKENVCKGCGFPFYQRDVVTDIKGYCSQGCIRRKARNLGWKENSGIPVFDFMRSKGEA